MDINPKFVQQYQLKHLLNNIYSLKILLLILCFTDGLSLFAQKNTILRGIVRDEMGEVIPFVPITISSKTSGTYTDTLGKFSFKANIQANDSLIIAYLGYHTQSIALEKNNNNQFFDIHLRTSVDMLSEVVIKADPNPGKTLMKKVLANSARNNVNSIKRFDAKRWVRNEVSTVDTDVQNKKDGLDLLFSSRSKAYLKTKDPLDTSAENITPLFFSEKISDYSQTSNPFGESETIIAVKKTNLETDKLVEHICRLDVPINLYDSKILIYNKAFESPLGSTALLFYDYFIEDSIAIGNNHFNIVLQLIPKTWSGSVFTGTIVVNDSAYALVHADLRLSKEANINYIEKMNIVEHYTPVIDQSNQQAFWILEESQISMQYEAGLDLIGIPIPVSVSDKKLIAKIQTKYDQIKINDPKADPNVKKGTAVVMRVYDTNHDDEFWNQMRPDTLTSHQKSIYAMAHNIQSDPLQMMKDKVFKTIVTGWYFWKDVAWIGPYGSLISRNEIEGTRFRVRIRTDEALIKKTGFYGHIAYGTLDEKWKGSLGVKQLWSTQPYSKTELFYSNDFLIASEWYDALDADNIVNSIFRKNVPFYRSLNEQISLSHDHQIASNWFGRISLINRNLIPTFDFPYQNPKYISLEKTPEVNPYTNTVHSTELSISLRYSWRERSRIFDYQRRSLGSKYPTVQFTYSKSIATQSTDFNIQKINLGVLSTTRITAKINLIWNAEAGKIFGKSAALLLYIPRGNDSYFTSRYVFNTMNRYEFVADKYLVWQSRLSLGGAWFDRIPLFKKLGWRERFTFNAFWGDMSTQNQLLNNQSKFKIANGKPYLEVGAGIENIFHLFSIEYFQRVNYDVPFRTSGIFGGVKAFF